MFALLFLASACSVRDAACGRPAPQGAQAGPTAITGETAESTASTTFTITFLGDSLTAGLGLLSQQAFPAKTEMRDTPRGSDVRRPSGPQRTLNRAAPERGRPRSDPSDPVRPGPASA